MHAPVVIQSALPCRCTYVLRHPDGCTVRRCRLTLTNPH